MIANPRDEILPLVLIAGAIYVGWRVYHNHHAAVVPAGGNAGVIDTGSGLIFVPSTSDYSAQYLADTLPQHSVGN